MNKQTSLSIDKETKKRANAAAKKMHLSLSGVTRILLNDFADGKIKIGTIAIATRDENGFTSAEVKAILKAAQEAKKGINLSKPFNTMDDFLEDLKK